MQGSRNYVGRSGRSLALSPEQAADLAFACGLNRLEKNPTMHYVRVPAGRLDDRSVADRVREAVGVAVDRSWRGPRWTRGTTTGPPARIPPTCPVHHYELAGERVVHRLRRRPSPVAGRDVEPAHVFVVHGSLPTCSVTWP